MSNTIKSSKTFHSFATTSIRKQVPAKNTRSRQRPIWLQSQSKIVGTTHELLAAGDVTDTAYCEIEVLHATATVSVGGDSGGSFVKWFDLKKGDPPAVMPRVGALQALT